MNVIENIERLKTDMKKIVAVNVRQFMMTFARPPSGKRCSEWKFISLNNPADLDFSIDTLIASGSQDEFNVNCHLFGKDPQKVFHLAMHFILMNFNLDERFLKRDDVGKYLMKNESVQRITDAGMTAIIHEILQELTFEEYFKANKNKSKR